MPPCKRCGERPAAVTLPYARLKLCEDCFSDFFVRRVARTVKEYKMFKEGDRVAVAVSGGKDSGALLHALKRAFPKQDVVAVHVNLGIEGYSDHCEGKVRELAKLLDVELAVYDLRKEEGISIDDFLKTQYRRRVCSPCGAIKRHAFNVLANEVGANVLATGHNLDDTVATMLSTLMAGDLAQLARLKPVLPSTHPKLPKKVKPLVTTPEVEDIYYVGFNELPVRSAPCPHAAGAPSLEAKELVELIEERRRGAKYQLLSVFVKKLIPVLERSIEQPALVECEVCGYPSSSNVCAKCRRVALAKASKAT